MPTITLLNIKGLLLAGGNPIQKSRIYGSNSKNSYRLLKPLCIKLSNGQIIQIPQDFIWDLTSVPRLLQVFISPDNDAEIAYLIHDYLYENRLIGRKFADDEMLKWARVVSGTKRWSLRNICNSLCFWAVGFFGKNYWKN